MALEAARTEAVARRQEAAAAANARDVAEAALASIALIELELELEPDAELEGEAEGEAEGGADGEADGEAEGGGQPAARPAAAPAAPAATRRSTPPWSRSEDALIFARTFPTDPHDKERQTLIAEVARLANRSYVSARRRLRRLERLAAGRGTVLTQVAALLPADVSGVQRLAPLEAEHVFMYSE